MKNFRDDVVVVLHLQQMLLLKHALFSKLENWFLFQSNCFCLVAQNGTLLILFHYLSKSFSAFGCDGAYASAHFEWYQDSNEGLFQYESCYPYTAREDPCNNDPNCNYEKAKQSSYSIIQNPSEEELKELVYSVPIYTLVNVRISSKKLHYKLFCA